MLFKKLNIALAVALAVAAAPSIADKKNPENFVSLSMPVTTQGPIWPPGELMDENGDFIVIGTVLRSDGQGGVVPTPGAALVSKDTVPPLDDNGYEDFSNIFAAPYDIIKDFDLSPGSPDRNIVLHTLSYGPPEGDFAGGGRVPKAGDTEYNLNSLPPPCLDAFPAESQKHTFISDSMPLHRASMFGFQGDQVAYNVDTGDAYDPFISSGEGCGFGCSGENEVDEYIQKGPVTLGDWVDGEAQLSVELRGRDYDSGDYTSGRFKIDIDNGIPNSVYTAWLIRANTGPLQGQPEFRNPDPSTKPNIITTDPRGRGHLVFDVSNPFPAPELDEKGVRIVGVGIAYHSDGQNWGACFDRVAAGYRAHLNWVSIGSEDGDFSSLVTVPR